MKAALIAQETQGASYLPCVELQTICSVEASLVLASCGAKRAKQKVRGSPAHSSTDIDPVPDYVPTNQAREHSLLLTRALEQPRAA